MAEVLILPILFRRQHRLKPTPSNGVVSHSYNLHHLCSQTNYALIASLAQSPKNRPSRSTPCLQNATDLLMRHHPTALSYSNEYFCDYGCPAWIQNHINLLSFPLSKQEAIVRPHVAQNAFLQIIGSFPPSSLVAYTDGSLTTDGSCSCAVFIKG